jgi:hypothetical protein
MNLFYRAFNAQTLAAVGITLPPKELSDLIEDLAAMFRASLGDIAEQRLGRPFSETDKDIIRAYFPDYEGVMQVELMRLFQEVEERATEIMREGKAA